MSLTAITGGIGAGKSVVSAMLTAMGYDVFDCDSEAKKIMDSDTSIKSRLKTEIHAETVRHDGSIDRQRISSVVFSDKAKLQILNDIVHGAVRRRINTWATEHRANSHLFVETAILYQSGLDKMVDDVIEVIAPDEIRIIRVVRRNNCDEAQVAARISAQQFVPQTRHKHISEIINDDKLPVLPQLLAYLASH